MEQLMLEPVERSEAPRGYRYFGPGGAVHCEGDRRSVFVGGTLVGEFDVEDKATRNVLVVALSRDPHVHLGRLAEAFELSEERVRQLRRKFESGGLPAVIEIRKGGREAKVTPRIRARLEQMFAIGLGIDTVAKKFPRFSRSVVARAHKRWAAEQVPRTTMEDATAAPPVPQTLSLVDAPLTVETETTAAVVAVAIEPIEPDAHADAESGSLGAAGPSLHTLREVPTDVIAGERVQYVQHVGTWIVLGMLHAWGLHRYLERLRAQMIAEGQAEARHLGSTALRVAVDAAVAALVIGEGTMEGVRRLRTASAQLLLRIATNVPGADWVRTVLHRFADEQGRICHLAAMFALLRRAQCERDPRAVFYVDNHHRRYTGKHVLRKGWRMQDKRAVAGASDFWVHDEDGRPLMRVPSPNHESLTALLRPIGHHLRDGLNTAGATGTRVMLVFDRGGAYANELAALRDAGFEFVTYERGPYPQLLRGAFEHELSYGDEVLRYTEPAKKNLGAGRGRVRRIHVLTPEGHQLNVLCVSEAKAEFVVLALLHRWARQENQFKYGVERLKLNQLDGRRVHFVPDDEEIPNPARRRLDHALAIARRVEGEARRQLAALAVGDARRLTWQQELQRVSSLQAELEKQRPHIPKRLPVGESELAGKLVRHDQPYKLFIDTLRLLIANIEAELAAEIGPLLPRAAEAKKTIATLLAAPGVVRVTPRQITVRLVPAGSRAEQRAFQSLLLRLNARRLTLPGDPSLRPLRFQPQIEGPVAA